MEDYKQTITFTCESNDGKLQEVSFDYEMNQNITKIIHEFHFFLKGMGFHDNTVEEFVPYCDVE